MATQKLQCDEYQSQIEAMVGPLNAVLTALPNTPEREKLRFNIINNSGGASFAG
jgi:phosphoenolpyruvate carboxylase